MTRSEFIKNNHHYTGWLSFFNKDISNVFDIIGYIGKDYKADHLHYLENGYSIYGEINRNKI